MALQFKKTITNTQQKAASREWAAFCYIVLLVVICGLSRYAVDENCDNFNLDEVSLVLTTILRNPGRDRRYFVSFENKGIFVHLFDVKFAIHYR